MITSPDLFWYGLDVEPEKSPKTGENREVFQ